jgi:carbamoyltransferase
MKILGISAYYHDSAAALIDGDRVLAAAQEERFSRRKHDAAFPTQAVSFCLESQNLSLADLDAVVYYEKPLLTFERLLETYLGAAPRGGRSFVAAMQVWLKEKLFLKTEIRKQLQKLAAAMATAQGSPEPDRGSLPELLFSEHHLSHAGAAFYPSPFEKAAVLCMDGVGEWATTSAWLGEGSRLTPLWEISFPHSLGLLYSAFTYYCGFKVNSGEYKLMGLAPYGKSIYAEIIRRHLVDIKSDGTFRLDLSYFKFHRGFRMTGRKFHQLFGRPPRKGETELSQFHMDLAASIQEVTEEIVLKLARSLRRETGATNLCLSGGVALNCVANGKLLREGIFERIWIQPAAGDAGSALGAALVAWHQHFQGPRIPHSDDAMRGTYLGPRFSNEAVQAYLRSVEAPFHTLEDGPLFEQLAALLDAGKVIGWFNGAMEFGPRALGGRSILGDPRNRQMQSVMNLKIKFRESFRPFAPIVLREHASEYFDIKPEHDSPYMLIVAPVRDDKRKQVDPGQKGLDKLKQLRSVIPAVTHVDYSARLQTVDGERNPRLASMMRRFRERTGSPVMINTSFNVRGEPIVCTPQDALRCFLGTEMDVLVLENFVIRRAAQKDLPAIDREKYLAGFSLD